MTTPRSKQIDLSVTPYYHVVSRCVRRAFLCGSDKLTRRSFDHRRGWLVERFRQLAGVFAIDVAAFACMSNHYHLILRVDRERAKEWTDDEVVRRWGSLCGGGAAYRYRQQQALSEADKIEIAVKTPTWRERLHDISWFMRLLNEFIARRANLEDGCKGRFWEGRFKSQALLDERALFAAMAYVDLNPIRATLAETLVDSNYTSVQERVVSHAKIHSPRSAIAKRSLPYDDELLPALVPFSDQVVRRIGHPRKAVPLPCTFDSYLALAEWTGRQLRKNKRGAIPQGAKSILFELGIDQEDWLHTVRNIRHGFSFAVGGLSSLTKWRDQLGQQWVKGLGRHVGRRAVQQT